jgi:hypothetical protein
MFLKCNIPNVTLMHGRRGVGGLRCNATPLGVTAGRARAARGAVSWLYSAGLAGGVRSRVLTSRGEVAYAEAGDAEKAFVWVIIRRGASVWAVLSW